MKPLVKFIAALTLGTSAFSSQAEGLAPNHTEQVAGFFRENVGQATVTALYDGYVKLAPGLLKGKSPAEIQTLLERAFLPSADGVQTAVNAYLVHTGTNLVLVDTGAASCFGPTLGNISANIKAAGYQPEDIDTVLLTHLHPDHACGLISEGKPAFPNATVWAADREAAFWLDEATKQAAPKEFHPFFDMAQNAVKPYAQAGRFKTFKPGEQLVAGFSAQPSPGHTAGHTAYLLQSGKDKLLIWGDIIHSYAVQFAHPDVTIEFDLNPAQAIASRKALLEQAAEQGLLVAGAHLPFPGMGRLRREGKGYSWVPVEFAPLAPAQ